MLTGWNRLQAALAAAVAASGVGVAATSAGGGGSAEPLAAGQILALVQRAPAALNSYPSVKMTLTFSIDAGGRHVGFTETGLISRDGQVGTIHMDLPNGLGAFDAVVSGRTIYAHVAASKLTLTGGRHWASVTLTGAQTQPVTGSNALDYLRLLAGADGQVTTVGHKTIDGAATTHYRVDVDVAKAAAAAPPQFGTADQTLTAAGVRTLPVDLWLDSNGAPRQMKMSYHLDGGSFTMTIRFRGSTNPVTVTPPPVTDDYPVSDFPQLAQFIANIP